MFAKLLPMQKLQTTLPKKVPLSMTKKYIYMIHATTYRSKYESIDCFNTDYVKFLLENKTFKYDLYCPEKEKDTFLFHYFPENVNSKL